jgi:hypothetical protein
MKEEQEKKEEKETKEKEVEKEYLHQPVRHSEVSKAFSSTPLAYTPLLLLYKSQPSIATDIMSQIPLASPKKPRSYYKKSTDEEGGQKHRKSGSTGSSSDLGPSNVLYDSPEKTPGYITKDVVKNVVDAAGNLDI